MLKHLEPSKGPLIDTAHRNSGRHWKQFLTRIGVSLRGVPGREGFKFIPPRSETPRLDRGWIIANHKLVSFHAAFLTSLLSIPLHVASRFDVMRQMFLSIEVVISSVMWYAAWHSNIAIHEMGHYLTAKRYGINASPPIFPSIDQCPELIVAVSSAPNCNVLVGTAM